ncbi:hypothetical protein BRC94_01170 [Halobacteriales archaeon QS_5_70_17]|nr:MAG: hypothetical protein BRC94_01170 [Halobacteriales archaeon QS_5_70_17]
MMIPLRVDEVMSTSVETTTPRATVEEAADRMRTAEVGSLIVVEDEDAVGIVTRTDLVDAIADALDVTSVTVGDVMSGPLMTVEADAPVEEAAEAFRRHEVKHLAVVEDGALAGVVTVTDLSYYLLRLSMLRSDSDRDDADYAALGTNETAYESADWEFVHDNGDGGEGDPDEVRVGDVVRFRKRLSDADVRSFAEASGDTNRLHLDEEFAAETRFGGRIVHGTLVSGLISAALARMPGLTIYLSQDLRFLAPVEVGETVRAVCEVVEALGDGKYRLTTAVYDESDERVIDGEAVVVIDELPYTVEEKLADV